MDLVAISVSHRTAPPHLRERPALSADAATQLMGQLVAAPGVEEAVARGQRRAHCATAVAGSRQRGRAG